MDIIRPGSPVTTIDVSIASSTLAINMSEGKLAEGKLAVATSRSTYVAT